MSAILPLLLLASSPAFALRPVLMPTSASSTLRHRAALVVNAPSTRASGASLMAAVDGPVESGAKQPNPVTAKTMALRVLVPLVLAVFAAGAVSFITSLLAPMTGPVAGGVKLVFAGAVAGVISRTCCAPLEMVSTIMMCRGDECGTMSYELRKAWDADGLRGLFKGNGANCLKVAPSRGTQVPIGL